MGGLLDRLEDRLNSFDRPRIDVGHLVRILADISVTGLDGLVIIERERHIPGDKLPLRTKDKRIVRRQDMGKCEGGRIDIWNGSKLLKDIQYPRAVQHIGGIKHHLQGIRQVSSCLKKNDPC